MEMETDCCLFWINDDDRDTKAPEISHAILSYIIVIRTFRLSGPINTVCISLPTALMPVPTLLHMLCGSRSARLSFCGTGRRRKSSPDSNAAPLLLLPFVLHLQNRLVAIMVKTTRS